MTEHRLLLQIERAPNGEKSRMARELRDFILDEEPEADIEFMRSDPEAQDIGATLILILQTPSIGAVALGVRSWLARRSTSEVVFKSGESSLSVDKISSRSASELGKQLAEFIDQHHSEDE
ncbi:hypothetical protein I6A60_26765 [Frankia sp. AgB1.9]|uniref:hypothetical protein n=1 Tax=unclassified Frankia TaxID=2632575 RepID=UPI0019347313|nr:MULTISPECIES: hypothetical protein [unclassified Frankia]MBL7488590.1 hypothetical protein [Frankia sp. AgW1.1]MBL7551432.1 hypothetical protein [Frankia sp. AgB1.9]MBL7622686.1 hypothetical protein [Frankia sp. AgB1.8]